MQFCDKCDNMLYIHSIPESQGLTYCCKNCDFKKTDDNPKRCIYENVYSQSNSVYDITHNKYTRYDPTLPRVNTIKCINGACLSNKLSVESMENAIIVSELAPENMEECRAKIGEIDASAQITDFLVENDDASTLVVKSDKYTMMREQLLANGYKVEYRKIIEPRIIFIKYNPEQLNFVYICEYCNSSWKK